LTPKSQKQAEIDTSKLPSDLAEIVWLCPELPGAYQGCNKGFDKDLRGIERQAGKIAKC
jgi:hypothetical protein